ncbi:hypothetical protein [Asticcacaulis sp. YBE204]|uniref:hypothetical protein n=1 Tax=Asticcacaulis sp. YBE204 TaxID=1282363 RepID=UPI0003C3BF48|nr:hypothetical protein [Asticcacaulis sp. YBE204]ESQ78507.1 hypothetical protein AEYBE204_13225 [Asticcacaulis sp. YBE204]
MHSYLYRVRLSGVAGAEWSERDLRDGPEEVAELVKAMEDPFTQVQFLDPRTEEWVIGPSIDDIRRFRDSLTTGEPGGLTASLLSSSVAAGNEAYQRGYIEGNAEGLAEGRKESEREITDLKAEIERLNSFTADLLKAAATASSAVIDTPASESGAAGTDGSVPVPEAAEGEPPPATKPRKGQ